VVRAGALVPFSECSCPFIYTDIREAGDEKSDGKKEVKLLSRLTNGPGSERANENNRRT